LLWLGAVPSAAQDTPPGHPRLEVFVLRTCPHCHAALSWLADVQARRPDLDVRVYEVGSDTVARERLRLLAREHGIAAVGVPAFLVGDRLLVGWEGAETTGEALLALLYPPARAPPPTTAPSPTTAAPPARADEVRAPIVGLLSARQLGLPLFTIALGLIDGFNPCAMWALLLILAILLRLQDRRRMLAIGGTFIAVGGLLYFAFLAAWLELFLLVGFSRALQVGLGLTALAVGALNLKDVVAFRRGPTLGIPEAAKPGIYARVRRVIGAPTLPLALVAVALLSVVVNVVELLCTAGLPAVYTHVLGTYHLDRPAYYGYLLLYVGAYVLDDGLMLALATVTLSRSRLQERAGRWLKLVSGGTMLALGLVLLLRPEWLLRLQ
jgi:hypothetical protein